MECFGKKVLVCVLCLAMAANVFAQRRDALVSYRTGRDLESAGRMDEAKQKYQEAVDICRTELAQNSMNNESRVVLTWSLIRLGEYRETIKICNDALKINSKEYRIIETQAEAYFYLDNYTESLKLFEAYVSGLPNGERVSTAMFFVGEIYRLQGRYEHADIAYSDALRRSSNVPLWWYRLGRVREAAKNNARAKEAYERALKLRPVYPECQEALKRVS